MSTLKKAGNQTLGNNSQPSGNSFNQHESSSLRKKVLIDHDGSSISFKQNSPPKVFVKTHAKANLYDRN